MKLILLLSVLCFTSAFAGDHVIMSYYMKTGCKDANLAAYISQGLELGCKKDGTSSENYKLDGKKLVADTYTSTDCSGTKTGTSTYDFVIDACSSPGSGASMKYGIMSASVWNGHKTGGGNLLSKRYEPSETCGGDVTQTMAYLSKAQGMCGPENGGSSSATWTNAAITITTYGSTDCTGTATATRVENFNVCNNETTAAGKASSYLTTNPAVSSGKKLTGFTSTLFLLCVALFTNSFL